MNNEYEDKTTVIDIPLNTGIEGFMLAIRKVLTLPGVSELHIDHIRHRGKLSFSQHLKRGVQNEQDIAIDFENVTPMGIVRNCPYLEEVDVSATVENAAVCLARLFERASDKHLFPVAFVAGMQTTFFDWMERTTGIYLRPEHIYGIPIYRDRHLPDEALLLCVANSREGSLIDVQAVYKILMPGTELPVRFDDTDVVEVMVASALPDIIDAPKPPKALTP